MTNNWTAWAGGWHAAMEYNKNGYSEGTTNPYDPNEKNEEPVTNVYNYSIEDPKEQAEKVLEALKHSPSTKRVKDTEAKEVLKAIESRRGKVKRRQEKANSESLRYTAENIVGIDSVLRGELGSIGTSLEAANLMRYFKDWGRQCDDLETRVAVIEKVKSLLHIEAIKNESIAEKEWKKKREEERLKKEAENGPTATP